MGLLDHTHYILNVANMVDVKLANFAFCELSLINSMRAHKMAIVVLSDSPMCLGPNGSLVVNASIAWSPSNSRE